MGVFLILAAAVFAAVASADAETQPSEAIGFPPFELKASNGYTVLELAGAKGPGEPGVLTLIVGSGGDSVLYSFPAQVGEESFSADLGALGEIDLALKLTGGTKTTGTPVEAASP